MIQYNSAIYNYYVKVGPGTSAVCHSYPKITQDLSNVVKVYQKKDTLIGYSTGNYEQDSYGYNWYQVWLLDKPSSDFTGWFREDVVQLPLKFTGVWSPTVTQKDADNVVKNTLTNDDALWKLLVVLSPAIKRAEALNISGLAAKKTVYDSLVKNYIARQNHIKNSSLLTVKSYVTITSEWLKITTMPGYVPSGLSGFWIPFCIGIAATAGLGYLIYREFKPDFEQGKVDLKIAGAFKEWLDKLPADQQAIIKKDLQDQLDEAYNAGKGGFWGNVKKIGIALGVFAAVSVGSKFLKNRKQNKD